ncbi:MAG: hypothetical protein ABS64_02975 [Microbacterium sp. SCN 69-37]|nr:MAG: hypothetical protein ABS64_02975 [Microbacterium sp. SCN 69-37]
MRDELGLTAELLLVGDRVDAATRVEVTRWESMPNLPFAVRVIEVDLGESGAARNVGVSTAAGEFVALVDGDDLVSVNYFAEAITLLRRSEVEMVAHPQYVLSFGARSLLWEVDSMLGGHVDYRDLLRHNLWPSSSVARHATYARFPFRSLDPELGYGPEDWVWNIDTVTAGITHASVPGTVFFYRVRSAGGVNHRHSRSLLPPIDLAGLRAAMPALPPGDSKGERERPSLAHRVYERALPVVRVATWWLSFELKHMIYRSVRWAYRLMRGRRGAGTTGEDENLDPEIERILRLAAEIDPAISWTAHSYSKLQAWHARDDGYVEVLEAALAEMGSNPAALVLAPWVGVGGADTVALNYALALAESPGFEGRTTIVGTFLQERTVHERIPGNVKYVHLWDRWLELPPEVRRRLLAQFIVWADPSVVISVNCFHLTESLTEYNRQISTGRRVFTTLFAFDRIGFGLPVNPITDDSQRQWLDSTAGVITDNTATARLVEDILALPKDRVLVHRQPVTKQETALPRGTRAYNNEYFSALNPFRLLWPHRLDEEKQPEALILIADELRRRQIPAVIDVWGQRVMSDEGDGLIDRLEHAGVRYRGPYTGGLAALDTYDYHALLLTSKSEGLPLVLVEALLRGLPVISAAVGGVPDLIRNGETGLLVPHAYAAEEFADAIRSLMADLLLRRRIIECGYERARSCHSWSSFVAVVGEDIVAGSRR